MRSRLETLWWTLIRLILRTGSRTLERGSSGHAPCSLATLKYPFISPPYLSTRRLHHVDLQRCERFKDLYLRPIATPAVLKSK